MVSWGEVSLVLIAIALSCWVIIDNRRMFEIQHEPQDMHLWNCNWCVSYYSCQELKLLLQSLRQKASAAGIIWDDSPGICRQTLRKASEPRRSLPGRPQSKGSAALAAVKIFRNKDQVSGSFSRLRLSNFLLTYFTVIFENINFLLDFFQVHLRVISEPKRYWLSHKNSWDFRRRKRVPTRKSFSGDSRKNNNPSGVISCQHLSTLASGHFSATRWVDFLALRSSL